MRELSYEAHRSGQVTLDANGNGTITLTPEPRWVIWRVTRVNVKTNQPSTTTPVPTAEVWLNDTSSWDNHHGGSRDGDLDVGTGLIIVRPGDALLVVFTGGRAGDIAYASAWGEYKTHREWPGA